MIVVECDEPAVGDRDAMGVAAEIGQDLCGSGAKGSGAPAGERNGRFRQRATRKVRKRRTCYGYAGPICV
jgi:hypothetical protein